MDNKIIPNYENLRDSLIASELDASLIDDIIRTVKETIGSSSIDDDESALSGITVLTPDGNFPVQCGRIVAVYAREQKNRVRAYSLKKALKALIDYYSHCLPITKLGVVVTDVWRPSELFTFEPALDFYEAKGTPTIIILKSNANLYLLNFPWR